jgi:hypothetical protein
LTATSVASGTSHGRLAILLWKLEIGEINRFYEDYLLDRYIDIL